MLDVTALHPATVLHFRERADSFLGAAVELEILDPSAHAPAIGLLSVHGCIALADAVLVAVEGTRAKGDDHAEAARRLRALCSAKRLPDAGIKHFQWLLTNKSPFSYEERRVQESELLLAKVKMRQFFNWAFLTFPAVAQIKGAKNA